ncbi:MAG: membrane protein insertase YidC [Armatimonadota bacterium]
MAGFYFFMPKAPAPPDPNAPSLYIQAQNLEKEGRTADPNVAIADRVKKLEAAVGKYEEYWNQQKDKNPVPPEAYQARFQQVNIYDYLATQLEGKRSGTHWHDQAIPKLKDMEKSLHNKQGTVTLEINGKTETRTGDLSQIASERLNLIRLARDEVNKDKWTYRILDGLVQVFGGVRYPGLSYFLALLVVVVFLKGITWPFQKKQYQYQRDMMRVAPLIKEAQEEMKARNAPPDEVQRRVFEIYKENNVNIAAGCLPMLVMMVVIFPVYWMVADYEFQFTHGTFLWIGSAASKNSPWLGDNLAQFDLPLFIIYMLSMVAFSLLQPKPADPQQAQQQKMMMVMMPLMFGVFMWIYQWSSAFMLYWLILNVVSGYQSWSLMRRYGLHAIAGGGGGTAALEAAPPPPLKPMKGVENGKKDGRNGRGNPRDPRSAMRPPKGSGKRK